MFIIDKLSYQNNLRKVHPAEKFIFCMGMLFIALISSSYWVFGSILLLSFLLLWYKAGVSLKYLLLLYLLPTVFGFVSVLPVVVSITTKSSLETFHLNLGWFKLILTEESLLKGLLLYLRILASASSFYLLILTTPIPDLEYLMRKMRLPSIISELFLLIYRFIFILMNMAGQILISQKSRLGYRNFFTSWNSFQQLVASLLARSYVYSQNSYQALLSRGYTGQIHLLEENYQSSLLNYGGTLLTFIALLLLNYYG